MRAPSRALLLVALFCAPLAALCAPSVARADGFDPFSPRTVSPAPHEMAVGVDESPIERAHDLLHRAKLADDAALLQERTSAEIDKRIGPLREQALAARKLSEKATGTDRDAAIATAEQLEAEIAVIDIERSTRMKQAAELRKNARAMREKAVAVIKGEDKPAAVAAPAPAAAPRQCRPPFFCADAIFRERL
jgi:hypothetical protein